MNKRIGKQEKQRLVEGYLCGESVENLSNEVCVSRSSVYSWVKNYRSGIQSNPINLKEHKELRRMLERQKLIMYILQNAPRKVNDLRDRGYKVSERLVADIMHSNGWFSLRSNAKALYKLSQKRKENVLKQNFTASKPNEVWVSDVTYFTYNQRTLFICVIIDLYSRKVVGCHVSKKNSTQLTKATFKSAYFSRKPEKGLIYVL